MLRRDPDSGIQRRYPVREFTSGIIVGLEQAASFLAASGGFQRSWHFSMVSPAGEASPRSCGARLRQFDRREAPQYYPDAQGGTTIRAAPNMTPKSSPIVSPLAGQLSRSRLVPG
jgi:hypothetical protein